ncbi:MAG TPA: mechanosensitive ion channel family protein [Ignavibacteriaceae bacterium]|nr:mechanosensitive ion channel family protein [Ignavibacteriaceae bacterium]
MKNILEQSYFGNTILNYIIAFGIFILGIIVIQIFKTIILKRLKKWSEATETTIDDFLVAGTQKTVVPLLYLGALYLAIEYLKIEPNTMEIITKIAVIVFTLFLLRIITSFIRFSLNAFVRRKGGQGYHEKELRGISTIIALVVWIVGIVFLLDNLGFRVSAVITGLGIGGIAVALAAQAILGDLFAYFVIFFDRPFEIGDFITVGDKQGSIENIGLKTTRVRSLNGEQLVFSNKDLTDSRIHNYKKMERRRIVFKLGVIYQTPLEQVKEIPGIVKQIIERQPDVTLDRGHFVKYGDFSLNFEFVYYVLSPDYNKYMDIQQSINLAIYQVFNEKGIEFAYPTQTLFMSMLNVNDSEKKELNS